MLQDRRLRKFWGLELAEKIHTLLVTCTPTNSCIPNSFLAFHLPCGNSLLPSINRAEFRKLIKWQI